MPDLLPEALEAMIKHAEETHRAGDTAKAEAEYLLALEYSSKVHHSYSAITGLVVLKLARFYEATKQKDKAAIMLGRSNAIIAAHSGIRF